MQGPNSVMIAAAVLAARGARVSAVQPSSERVGSQPVPKVREPELRPATRRDPTTVRDEALRVLSSPRSSRSQRRDAMRTLKKINFVLKDTPLRAFADLRKNANAQK